MLSPSEWRCAMADIPAGCTLKFHLMRDTRQIEAFVVHHDAGYSAYVNRCPHVGTPLDLWPNEFLAEDGRRLICSTHGAIFEPDTGRCIAGPCVDDALEALDVEQAGDAIVVRWRSPR